MAAWKAPQQSKQTSRPATGTVVREANWSKHQITMLTRALDASVRDQLAYGRWPRCGTRPRTLIAIARFQTSALIAQALVTVTDSLNPATSLLYLISLGRSYIRIPT
jgi:hypothetical protein